MHQVGGSQELCDERCFGVLVDLGRGTHSLDTALVHDRDGVRHRHGFFLIVRDVNEGDSYFVLDPLELDLHLFAKLEVEGAERLVEEQNLWMIDQCSSQRDSLLLATGQRPRPLVLPAGQLNQLEHLADSSLDVGVCNVPAS